MEANLIYSIITWIILIIVFGYQKNKISSMNQTIENQEKSLSALKTLMDVINIDEIKKYVKLKSENIKMESEAEKKKYERQFNEKLEELTPKFYEIGTTIIKENSKTVTDLLNLCFAFVPKVRKAEREKIFNEIHYQSDSAKELVNNMRDGTAKILNEMDKLNERPSILNK